MARNPIFGENFDEDEVTIDRSMGDFDSRDIPYTETEDYKNLMRAQRDETARARPRMDMMDERDRREMEMVKVSGAALKSKPKKSSIVTKEQLKASGFDNLRDYMNAQKGLTRRGDKTAKPAAAKPAAVKTESAKPAAVKSGGPDKATVSSLMDSVVKTSPMKITEGRKVDPNVMRSMRLSAGKDDEYGMKKGGKVKKYAKGGSVSSASKRADGCAQRGKTRGKMV